MYGYSGDTYSVFIMKVITDLSAFCLIFYGNILKIKNLYYKQIQCVIDR